MNEVALGSTLLFILVVGGCTSPDPDPRAPLYCPKALPPIRATCPLPLEASARVWWGSVATLDDLIIVAGLEVDDEDVVLAAFDRSRRWAFPPTNWEPAVIGRAPILVGGPDRVWLLERARDPPKGLTLGSWSPTEGLRKPERRVAPLGFNEPFQLAEGADGYLMVWTGLPPYLGATVLDGAMNIVSSGVYQAALAGTSTTSHGAAIGEGVLAVVWRDGQGGLFIDLLAPDLARLRQFTVPVADSPGRSPMITLSWRDGGFDVFLGGSGPSLYGRVGLDTEATWITDFLDLPSDTHWLKGLHQAKDGSQFLLYSRHRLPPDGVLGNVSLAWIQHGDGPAPTVTDVLEPLASAWAMASTPDGLAILSLDFRDYLYVTYVGGGPLSSSTALVARSVLIEGGTPSW